MRYLTVLAHPGDGVAFHPLAERLAADPALTREAIHHVELLPDNTILLFAEGSGDSDRYEAIMADSDYVEDYLVSGDDRWMAVSQSRATDTARRLLERHRESDAVVETPIRIRDDGALRITYVGSDADLGALAAAARDAPISLEVLETGDYDPDEGSLSRHLTTRQQEVLNAAVALGYYGQPRTASQADLADELGVAPSTVGEHLRKIEARVFGALAD
ncbi:helix-turn-helix domain-containing protein [Halobacterium litoreum]|uniref:Helix-turn-helix domain-containing protein n=1 Tax=Halobacterium litoreum TaxID=2039234 RepID=A0ABD5NCW8_9EURY|nr:helix-turn-helix domain-containing protein [Halobacterium litoreum]UHH14236.1 helix-turn-helix domain-containing protein [Halobacterium litoreum]